MSTKADVIKYLEKVPDNEPLFLLRAQDSLAMELVELWALRARSAGTPQDKILSAMDCLYDMSCWPIRKNPD